MVFAEIYGDEQVIRLTSEYADKVSIERIPGKAWDPEQKQWTVPISWATCVQLRAEFGMKLTIGPNLVKWATNERSSRVDQAMKLREMLNVEVPSGDLNEDLYPFQAAGVEFLLQARDALLGDEMGTGKTIQVLEALRVRQWYKKDALPALVICPNTTKTNWAREMKRWFPSANPYIVAGSLPVRRRILAQAAKDPLAFVIVNFEGVRGHSRLAPYGSVRLRRCLECDKHGGEKITDTRCEVHPKEFNAIPWATVIVDEAHRMKDPKALQTRAAWAVGHGPSVQRRWALTGTAIANDPSELWSVMHFVNPLEYPRKTAYVDRYCLMAFNGYGGLSVVGLQPTAREEFHKIFDPRYRRMTKNLVELQLPKKIHMEFRVEMTPKQRKAYEEMEDTLVTRLENGDVIVAKSNLSAQIRLLQFAASMCEVDEVTGVVTPVDPSPKIDALMEIITDHGDEPLVVAASHKKLINLAAKRLAKHKIRFGLITGDQDEWDRQKALDDLDEGKIQVLLFTMKAGGTGLNMTRAGTLVYLQQDWSMVEMIQTENRVHRIGSEKHHKNINIITIVTEGTVEETQSRRYREKLSRLEEINRDRDALLKQGLPTDELDALLAGITNSYLGEP